MGTLTKDHSNMMISGEPNANLLSPDGVHLNNRGISHLAASIKYLLIINLVFNYNIQETVQDPDRKS